MERLIINTKPKNLVNTINLHNNFKILSERSSSSTTLNQNTTFIKATFLEESSTKNKYDIWLINKLKKENLEDFIPKEPYQGYNSEVLFLHKTCNKTFRERPNNLFRRKNKCPHCNKEEIILNYSNSSIESNNLSDEKFSAIQKKMDTLYNGEFKFIKTHTSDKFLVEIEHTICKRRFTDYRRKLYSNKLKCPYCENSISNNFISTKEKIRFYENKLEGKFEIIDGFTTQSEKINIKRKSCGHTFKRTLNELLKKNYKDICPECNRLKRLDSLAIKLELKYNNRFKVLNGVEKYQNNESCLMFLDTLCDKKFKSTFTKLLNSNNFECPHCKNKKNMTVKTKAEVYNKYKGEYLMIGDYIDSRTPILFRHTKCKHVFFATKKNFFNAKTPCKTCRNKLRSLKLKEAQKKVDNKFGKLFTLKGIYENMNKDMPVLCNNCHTVEEVSLKKLLSRKQCKHCKTIFK